MAVVERGKGKRKQIIEVVQFGDVLRSQENDAGDERLPGYRRCASDAAARTALIAEVRAHLDAGMQPADDEARAIAASRPPAPSGPPTLPIRQDLAIYNEATGFVVTSRKMAGKAMDDGSAAWKKAVTKGDMLPMSLVQDDPFIIRIVAGDKLTKAESAEWVARLDWHLSVPDGKLCVTGGAVFANEDFEKDDPYHEGFVGQILVPKGHYRVALYSIARGLGDSADRPEDNDEGEQERVDFLLHLEPIAGAPKTGLAKPPDDGWFSGDENRRVVKKPAGVPAHDVLRPRDESAGGWTYVWRVFESLPAIERKPVRGDAVSLPLASLGHAARLAWYGSRFTMIELRLSAPPGGALDFSGEWPEHVVAVNENGAGRIFYDNDIDVNDTLARMPQLAERLRRLPDGTVLDICSIAQHQMAGSPDGAGMIFLRGMIRDGAWRIAQAYPETDATTLQAALKFVADSERDPVKAIGAFAERFSKTWPTVKLTPIAEETAEDEDGGDGMFPAKPIKGAAVFTAPGGREYHATMALLVSEKVAAEVQKRERALSGAGFMHVGDLVCSDDDKVAYRGYAKAGNAWAYFKVSAPGAVTLHVATTFTDENDSFVTDVGANASFKDALAEHDETIDVLVEQFGDARPIAATSKNLAETIEAVLLSE